MMPARDEECPVPDAELNDKNTDDQNVDASNDDMSRDASRSVVAGPGGSALDGGDAGEDRAMPESDPAAAATEVGVMESEVSEADQNAWSDDDGRPVDDPPQYGVGPFSIRETAIGGVWLVAFAISFFSLDAPLYTGGIFSSVWMDGISWVLAIAVPTVAVFLLALRRLSPSGIRRVGSLGIDQFASVAFSVAAVWWIQHVWEAVQFAMQHGTALPYTWIVWVESVLMIAGVVLTVAAPFLPVLDEDFQGRPDALAHRNARSVRPISPRPHVVRPVVAPDEPAAVVPEETVEAGPATTVLEVASSPQPQAFWALAPEDRPVVDESGAPLFVVGPTAWALVIEERDDVFVVRHEDGRTGYLRDVSGVTRG
jgi:hypothetical protein